jgi:hypothetical protein
MLVSAINHDSTQAASEALLATPYYSSMVKGLFKNMINIYYKILPPWANNQLNLKI